MEELLEFKKNIISWYPITNKDTVLQIGKDEEIYNALKEKTDNISVIENLNKFEIQSKFDYVTMIGNFEKIESEQEIINLIEIAKKSLNSDGKILLAMKNKFAMKYWAGDRRNLDAVAFESIVKTNENIFSIQRIKKILDNLNLKYKFYYPLPDYEVTNVIYTDEFLPSNDNIDARVLTFCGEEEFLNFSERDAYKQLVSADKNLFPFFANSFFIEISNKDNFEDIRFVSFSVTRKKEYRIKTIIRKDNVYKYADSKEAINHINKISNNIKILNDCNIEVLGKTKDNVIECEFLNDAISYDELLMQYYRNNGLNACLEKIKEFQTNILNKLPIENNIPEKTVFEKYEVELPEDKKQKLHFTKYGVLDLIFQNCLVKDNKLYIYDQEWFEENVPIEFLLYRDILYFSELKNLENIDEILKTLNLEDYSECFYILEEKLQDQIVDKDIWNLHINSIRRIGTTKHMTENLEERLGIANNLIEEYKKQIEELTNCIHDKDAELVNYADQLRNISNSLSWKITKPLRSVSEKLHSGNKK